MNFWDKRGQGRPPDHRKTRRWAVFLVIGLIILVGFPVRGMAEISSETDLSISQPAVSSDSTGADSGGKSSVAESDPSLLESEILSELEKDLNLEEADQAIADLMGDQHSMKDMVQALLEGQNPFSGDSGQWIQNLILEGLGIQKDTILQVILLAILAAVLANLSALFADKQISDVAFYMVYLFLMVLLLGTFNTFSGEVEEILGNLSSFMRALLPSFYLAMAASGEVTAAGVFYQVILGLIWLVESCLLKYLLPGIRLYFLMEMVNGLTKEKLLSRFSSLLEKLVGWSLSGATGIFLGISLIQRLVAPAVDALKQTVTEKTAELIPGIGNLFGGVTDVVISTALLVKNCLGAAAVIMLAAMGIVPILRLFVASTIYQLLAAIVQPVSDDRITGSIHHMGASLMMLVRLIVTVEILFLLTVLILAGSLT